MIIVGAGNSAGQAAMYFARYAGQVTMLTRSPLTKSMSSYLIDQISATPNITVRTNARVAAAHGDEHLSELAAKSDMWLNEQGRLTEPMVKRPGSDYYEPIGWDDALDLLAAELRGLDSPEEALFYTSGRLSNEAAFLCSCSRGRSAPTICPTAATCAMNPVVPD